MAPYQLPSSSLTGMHYARRTGRGLSTLLVLNFILLGPQVPSSAARPRKAGDGVHWTTFSSQKSATDPHWGEFLTDLETHLPAQYGATFQDKDRVVHAHETTHGINAHLHNLQALDEPRLFAFYVGANQAALIREPRLRISDIAALVPKSLRKERYEQYLIAQQKDWEDDPLYLFDEWVAYGNGARAGVELTLKGLYKPDKCDAIFAVLEFNVYAAYTVLAARKIDKAYDSRQLTEFLAWNLRRSMALYRAGYHIDAYNWDDNAYLRQLRSSHAAAELRRFLRELYGESWCEEVMGFSRTE